MIFTLVFCVWKIKPINVKVWFLPAKRSWGILFHLIKQWLWALFFPSSLTFWLWNESMWWRDKGVGRRLGGIKREFLGGGACVLVICKIWMNIFDRLVSCNGGGLEARLPPPGPLSSKSREKSTSVVSLFGRPLQIIPVLKGKISLSFSLSLSSGMLGWDHLTIAEPYSFWNLPWFSIISYCFLDIFLSRFYWLWPRECLLCRGLPRTGPMRGPKGNEAPQIRIDPP